MIRDTARAFATEQLAPNSAAWDRESTFPTDAIRRMGELGFMGMLTPLEWDGAGADMVTFASVIEEIAAGDGSCSTILSVHNSVACMPILTFGSVDQKERYLRPLARGEMLGGFALSEPDAGSDAAAIAARATSDGGDWVLNGTKQFITSGKNGDLIIAFAVTDPAAGKGGISAFIVPTNTPGYTVSSVERKLGQRASDTCQIRFDDMRLGGDMMLGEEGQGLKIALGNLEGGRIGIAAQAVGMARTAFEAAQDYAKIRESMGKPIIEHQTIGFRLADMATRIETARQLYLHAAEMRQNGTPCLQEASMAKLHASEMSERVCSDAIQVHGGVGYTKDYPVEQIYRDARVSKIYEGSSDIQRLVIARQLAG